MHFNIVNSQLCMYLCMFIPITRIKVDFRMKYRFSENTKYIQTLNACWNSCFLYLCNKFNNLRDLINIYSDLIYKYNYNNYVGIYIAHLRRDWVFRVYLIHWIKYGKWYTYTYMVQ